MKTKLEFIGTKVIPEIRKRLAKALRKAGHDQKDIAAMLGLTEGAVSQYLSGKRANFRLNLKITPAVFNMFVSQIPNIKLKEVNRLIDIMSLESYK